MTSIRIQAGPFGFKAQFELEKAPRTCAKFQTLLPYKQRIIHVRWSGEGCWIPLGDFDFSLPYENHTSHPAPGEIILYPGGISETEIERMLEESIVYAEQDFAERQAVEARTEAESILAATGKALRQQQAGALSGEERAKIDTAVAALREAISGADYKLMRKRIDELNQATQHLAEVMMNSAVNTVLQGKRLADF